MTNLTVKTSFNTTLSLESKTLGRRILAYFLDILFIFLYMFLMVRLLGAFDYDFFTAYGDDLNSVLWGIQSIIILPAMFYTLISETASGGYTLGKYIAGIKVVKIDGFQPSFVDYFIRWIFRMVDIYSLIIVSLAINEIVAMVFSIYSLGLVGLIAIVQSKHRQRIGDMVAGTAVIRSKVKQNIGITILKELSDDYEPKYAQVIKLSDNDARIIKETYDNAVQLNDTKLIKRLVKRLEEIMEIEAEGDPRAFIRDVLKDFNFYTQNM